MKFPALLLAACTWAAAQQPATPTNPEAKPPDSLHDLSGKLETLSRRVSRSLVQIFSSGFVLGGEGETGTSAAVITRQRATGSGVILSADGYIVKGRFDQNDLLQAIGRLV